VLHVIPAIAPRYGGPSRAVVDMCRALQARGATTLIATTDADGRGHLAIALGTTTTHEGVPAIFFARRWVERYQYSPSLARWLDNHVADFDVVHIHGVFSHPCISAARSCRRRSVPYVLRPLGSLDPWSMRRSPVRKRVLWRLGVRQMLDGAAAIQYTTDEEKRLAEASIRLGRGVVIPLGVDPALDDAREGEIHPRGQLQYLERGPYVLVLARLDEKKGLELLIRAFAEVRSQVADRSWRLVIAGDGIPGYVERLRELARRVSADRGEEAILFTGWLQGEEKRAVLRGAELLSLPSYQENFGLAVVEALACGVPVLISPHVNLAPEIESAGGGWISQLQHQELVRTLGAALSDPAERRRRGAAGRSLVWRRFSWAAIAVQLLNLYGEISMRQGARSVTG
jgi:glycosyltransferase involved in cell wall biosynthesis